MTSDRAASLGDIWYTKVVSWVSYAGELKRDDSVMDTPGQFAR